jgi:hypothetical protein
VADVAELKLIEAWRYRLAEAWSLLVAGKPEAARLRLELLDGLMADQAEEALRRQPVWSADDTYRAFCLAPDLDTLRRLLRGEAVPRDQLDQTQLARWL